MLSAMNSPALDLASPAAWWRWARQWRKTRLVDGVDRIAVLEHVHEGGELGPRYAFMVVMSCGIAALGLLQNSAAVIIGAMLISPLMGPIINLGMGLATFDLRTVRESLRTLGAGVALALAIAIPLGLAVAAAGGHRRDPGAHPPDLLRPAGGGAVRPGRRVCHGHPQGRDHRRRRHRHRPDAAAGGGRLRHRGGQLEHRARRRLPVHDQPAGDRAVGDHRRALVRVRRRRQRPSSRPGRPLLIVGTFVLLSIPLGLALKRIALQSQTELTVRTTLDAAAAGVNGRVSALRVDTTGDGVGVDAVVLVPTHAAGLEARLQRTLGERLGRPVAVRVREVLTADDATVARQQGTLAELKRSVLALQDAESVRAQKQQAAQAQQARVTAALLPYLGRLQRAASGPGWELWLAADARVSLARAHADRKRHRRRVAGRRGCCTAGGASAPAGHCRDRAVGPATDDAIGADPRSRLALEARLGRLQSLARVARARRPRLRTMRSRGCMGTARLRERAVGARHRAWAKWNASASGEARLQLQACAGTLNPRGAQPSAAGRRFRAAPGVRSMAASAVARGQ
jgi:hypothetical protein